MVWNSVMRKTGKWICSCASELKEHQMTFFPWKCFGNNGFALYCLPKYLQEGEVCCGCRCTIFTLIRFSYINRKKTHSEYFHPAFIGLIIFISSNFGGSQILFDVAKSNLVLVGILKFRCAVSHSQKFLWLPLPSHGNNTAIYGAFPWTQ